VRRPGVGLTAIGVVLVSVVGFMVREPGSPDFAGFLLVILTARVAAETPTAISLAVAVLAMALAVVLGLAGVLDTSVNLVVGTAFAWFAGYEVRAHQQLTRELMDAQAALADQAAAAERHRLARELHDLVAHTLSVTMLHLTGARLALEDLDIAEARAALADAERAGREAHREMRQTVGLLGRPTTAALPVANDIPGLVAGYRSAGLHVDVDVQGDLSSVSDDAGLALYRITQESLANAARHAPGQWTKVSVAVGPKEVCVTVRNHLSGSAVEVHNGRGLPGMAERATLLGGSLSAGPISDVWEVRALVPSAGT